MRKRLLREDGFTLPEVMVTIVLMLTVTFALYGIFDAGIRVFSFGNNKTEAVENARLGLEKMEREIRAAYPYDKANGSTMLFPSSSPNSLTFGNDRNGDFKITVPDEEIVYRLNGTPPTPSLGSTRATMPSRIP